MQAGGHRFDPVNLHHTLVFSLRTLRYGRRKAMDKFFNNSVTIKANK